MLDRTDERRRDGHEQMATGEAKLGPIGLAAIDLLAISPTALH